MPPRSSWKGFLKLSLVSVPVKAYTANATGAEIRLNQLHAECHNRIRYQKTCPVHGEVPNAEIVSGYEFSKGQYVVIDLEELSKLRTEADKSVQIDGFIGSDEIDPVYYSGRTYYLVPDGPVGQKPYSLLHDGMVDRDVYAIAKVVIAGKEQLVLLRPMNDMLTMTVVNYKDRIKPVSSFEDEVVKPDVTKEEVALTETLINASRIEDFDFAAYKDEYTEKLTKLIEAKVEGQEVVAVPEPEEPQIINLMEALKASVERARGTEAPREAPARKAGKKATQKMAKSARRSSGGRKKKTG